MSVIASRRLDFPAPFSPMRTVYGEFSSKSMRRSFRFLNSLMYNSSSRIGQLHNGPLSLASLPYCSTKARAECEVEGFDILNCVAVEATSDEQVGNGDGLSSFPKGLLTRVTPVDL